VNGAQISEPHEEYFVMVNRTRFGAKISGKMPALPHTRAKNYYSAQIFVSKTSL
jgi:hypothetical protein